MHWFRGPDGTDRASLGAIGKETTILIPVACRNSGSRFRPVGYSDPRLS
jgi:hypothetical protein